MSNKESLKAAMRESLEANGTISHLKAELRAAIFERLSDVTTSGDGRNVVNPPVPPENMVINELIKEYLTFNGLEHTLAVFQLEARSPDSQVPRRVLASELNMAAAPSSVPLLYAMLHEARLSKDMGP
ncbi:putative FOP N terminal dimerization domain containing protein [Leishmania utingensis]|uniref:Centrosomal protein 20 n=1 Tax=Leishmania utingensis TaxID=653362 RepID=A0AAW2ZYJ9_9TRYP